ncbi:hypothetical protein SAMN05421736_12352 [Evansella caseinilytica]|uniref:Uncharacterized protein n=1 Tax=Evansella caseinilytica TaxID=1503961 RepID=A0A1H3UM00_9BACI|nr:hypothetical protein [Evansella caseinilytica]SDZ63472.1 hypothetical protein SAMN05421736_12352 [Evansella caseinilytica]
MEYWDLTENPAGLIYKEFIKVLCDYSDAFFFVTRKELKYNQEILDTFHPYVIHRYQTNEWANTIAKGSPATVFVFAANADTCHLLQQSANALYDWVAPNLPEDLTFIKNRFEWFTSTTHEKDACFSIRSEYYRNIIHTIEGLKLKKVE